MKSMKIGVRLGIGFAVVVLMLIATAIFGTTRLSALNSATNLIVKDRVPKVRTVNQLTDELNTIARCARNALLLTDQADVKKELDRVAESRKKIAGLLDELDKSLVTEEGKDILKEVQAVRGPYVEHVGQLMKLLDEGRKDEAKQLMFGEIRKQQSAYFEALQKFEDYLSGVMEKAASDAEEQYRTARLIMIAMSIAAVIIAALVAVFVTRSVTGPINDAVRVAQTVASGDLTSTIRVVGSDETGQLLKALKEMNDSLVKMIGQIRSGSDTIATASAQIASGNADLSSRTEEQASSLEETASSMEELTSTVKQNADNARQANQLAEAASGVAVKGGDVVSQVVETMTAIDASSKKMADIISVIDGIAFQTNILALNAAVEAARAGEQGRGFAVVASEVRNLAQRSASAAKEIKTLIDDSVAKVESGGKLVAEAGGTMEEVVSSIRRVNDIMSEITAASAEQSAGIEQVNQAVVQMDTVTQQNAALVEESAAAAESMQQQARSLVQLVSSFKTGSMAQPSSAIAVRPAGAKPAQLARVSARTAATTADRAEAVARIVDANSARKAPALPKATGDDWEEF